MLKSSHTYSKNSCTIHCPPGRAGRALNNITAAALCTGLTECGGILEEMHGWLPSAGVADGVRKSKLKLKILAVLRAWMAILL